MLQNGLYWSFYCCSSVWSFVQIVKILCRHHFAKFYKCQGETSRASFKWTNISKLSPHRHTGSRPIPTPPGRSNIIFLSHSGIKRNQIKVAGNIFSSILYHSAKTNKKNVWEESKPRTSAVNENMFQYLYMSEYIYFDMFIALPLSYSPLLPFYLQYLHQSIKKVY